MQAMRIGEFEFHPDAGELCRDNVTCRLQPQTVALLVQLVEHAGEVLSREDLRKSLWQGNTYGEFDDGLNHAVARLREAFGDAARSPQLHRDHSPAWLPPHRSGGPDGTA